MKQLISVIVGKIAQQIRPGEVNMVRLENFDYPILYKSVCLMNRVFIRILHRHRGISVADSRSRAKKNRSFIFF